MLSKVISGGQTGADQAGLESAKICGFETGGTAPHGFKTLTGPNYDLRDKYGLVENDFSNYAKRTVDNVKNSDGTIRLAYNFNSPGEKCTLTAIKQNDRPYYDVDLNDPIVPSVAANWIIGHGIEVLNVAGNADRSSTKIFDEVKAYLINVFNEVKRLEKEIF